MRTRSSSSKEQNHCLHHSEHMWRYQHSQAPKNAKFVLAHVLLSFFVTEICLGMLHRVARVAHKRADIGDLTGTTIALRLFSMASCSIRGFSCSRASICSAASLRAHSHLPSLASILHFHSAAALSKRIQSTATNTLTASVAEESGFLVSNATFQALGLGADIRNALEASGITQPAATQVKHPLELLFSSERLYVSERQAGSSLHGYTWNALLNVMP